MAIGDTIKIDITPVGCSTPEGVERVNKAMAAFEASHANVANNCSAFIMKYADEIKAAVVRSDDEDVVEDYKEMVRSIEERRKLQDEFLRAVAGR